MKAFYEIMFAYLLSPTGLRNSFSQHAGLSYDVLAQPLMRASDLPIPGFQSVIVDVGDVDFDIFTDGLDRRFAELPWTLDSAINTCARSRAPCNDVAPIRGEQHFPNPPYWGFVGR